MIASIEQTDSEAAYEPGPFAIPTPSPRPPHSRQAEKEKTAGRVIGKRLFVWLAKLAFGVGLVIRFVFGSAGRQYGIGPLTRLGRGVTEEEMEDLSTDPPSGRPPRNEGGPADGEKTSQADPDSGSILDQVMELFAEDEQPSIEDEDLLALLAQ